MTRHSRRAILAAALGAPVAFALPARAATPELEVYRSPTCGCCGAWIDHMRANGFEVRVIEVEDLTPVKERFGVPPELDACHTGFIDGYVVEGHVPAKDVARLLAEKPDATGIAVPGMPVGSPGMEQGPSRDAFDVILFSDTERRVFARYDAIDG